MTQVRTTQVRISGTALIVDGDIIAINGMKVRLSGIDNPREKQTCRKAGVTWKCGYEATETLREWTHTKEVRCIGDDKRPLWKAHCGLLCRWL